MLYSYRPVSVAMQMNVNWQKCLLQANGIRLRINGWKFSSLMNLTSSSIRWMVGYVYIVNLNKLCHQVCVWGSVMVLALICWKIMGPNFCERYFITYQLNITEDDEEDFTVLPRFQSHWAHIVCVEPKFLLCRISMT